MSIIPSKARPGVMCTLHCSGGASNRLTMTTPIIISNRLCDTGLAILHCVLCRSLPPSISSTLSSTSCSSKSGASLSGCSTSQPGQPCPHVPYRGVCACVCACEQERERELTVAQEEGGSLCSPQLKGRGITGTQTLIKAFQPPMAPLIQS